MTRVTAPLAQLATSSSVSAPLQRPLLPHTLRRWHVSAFRKVHASYIRALCTRGRMRAQSSRCPHPTDLQQAKTAFVVSAKKATRPTASHVSVTTSLWWALASVLHKMDGLRHHVDNLILAPVLAAQRGASRPESAMMMVSGMHPLTRTAPLMNQSMARCHA